MYKTIDTVFGNKIVITPAEGDTSITIADLARFVEFDVDAAQRYDTKDHCIAFDALADEYGNFEMAAGATDYYDGCWMKFTDGSMIKIVA